MSIVNLVKAHQLAGLRVQKGSYYCFLIDGHVLPTKLPLSIYNCQSVENSDC